MSSTLVILNILEASMTADCKGAYGFFKQADHLVIDKGACPHWPAGKHVAFVEGGDPFFDPIAVGQKVQAACAAARLVKCLATRRPPR